MRWVEGLKRFQTGFCFWHRIIRILTEISRKSWRPKAFSGGNRTIGYIDENHTDQAVGFVDAGIYPTGDFDMDPI